MPYLDDVLNPFQSLTGDLTPEDTLQGTLTPEETMNGYIAISDIPAGVTELTELTDVNISNPLNDEVLTYDAATQKWINKQGGGGGGGTSDYTQLENKPSINEVTLVGELTTSDLNISYNDLTDTPELAAVATSGDYDDLINKPELAAVATSGDYDDLINKPAIPDELGDLSDVQLEEPINGQIIMFDEEHSVWSNVYLPQTDSYIPYRDTETQIGTWIDGVTPVYQKYIEFNSMITLQPNTNTNLAPLAGDIQLLGGGCIRLDTTYTGYFPFIQLVANGTYLQGNNIRSAAVGVNAVLIQYFYRS